VFKSLSDFAFQIFFGGCFRSQARSKIFLEAVRGSRHVPKYFWRLSEAPDTFQNFFGGCPRLLTRSKIFLEAVRGSRHVPKFFWRPSEAPDTFQNFFGGCPRLQTRSKIFLEAVHTGGGRPPSKGFDMLFILSGFLFYGVREKRRAELSAVALGAALLFVGCLTDERTVPWSIWIIPHHAPNGPRARIAVGCWIQPPRFRSKRVSHSKRGCTEVDHINHHKYMYLTSIPRANC